MLGIADDVPHVFLQSERDLDGEQGRSPRPAPVMRMSPERVSLAAVISVII
jgi:hypothetical protein